MEKLNESYWNNRYNNHDDPWDLGEVSPPIKNYVDQLKNKSLRILIPGGGNSHEAEYLFDTGFKNVYVVDFSKTALLNIKSRVPKFPSNQLIHSDFFDVDMTFDLILEQTFFCALNPNLRAKYIDKMHQLLSDKGKLVGLLFNQPLHEDRPPFGGNKALYTTYFDAKFDLEIMESSYNSISHRQGNELFFKAVKK